MDQRNVALGRIGGQQRESDRGGIAIGAVPHQPPAGLTHSLPICAQRSGNDVVVAMNRDVDIAEGADEFTRLRARAAEVLVEDDSDIGPVEPLISRPPV
ncbi:hypothetical protein GCM10025331_81860 [Actinoplanes utahensis]|nr:hypothetical protein Aut01nite_52400 [Actinoplanes utahensis]